MDTLRRTCTGWRVLERPPLTQPCSPLRKKQFVWKVCGMTERVRVWVCIVCVHYPPSCLHSHLGVYDGEGRAWPLHSPTSITASFPGPAREQCYSLWPHPIMHHMEGQWEQTCPPDSEVRFNIPHKGAVYDLLYPQLDWIMLAVRAGANRGDMEYRQRDYIPMMCTPSCKINKPNCGAQVRNTLSGHDGISSFLKYFPRSNFKVRVKGDFQSVSL